MADMTVGQATAHHDEHGHDDAFHNENLKFGVWLYLASEIVLFTMLIAGYAIFRANQPEAINLVKGSLGLVLVTVNTFILLASSYAMVMGLRAIEMGNKRGFYQWIGLTAILGTVFVGGQYIEYTELGHLNVSLNKQDFTVATTIFEDVNEVEAVLTATTVDNSSDEVLGTSSEIVEIREEALPADGTVIDSDAETTTTVAVTSYIVDFENDAALFENVNLANFEIRVADNYSLLDADGNAITEPDAIETALVNYHLRDDNDITDADLSRARRAIFDEPIISLNNLAVTDIDGNVVPFSDILNGQAVELAPDQYNNLNAYFQALLGNSASNYGMRFYAPTAFHGAHVIVGVLWALWVLWRGYKGHYDNNAIGVEMFGLYWHFVDVVWIGLFTLIYLV